MVRRPRGDCASSCASSASATAGYSAAGSAWASDPPIVPRLRIWKCPISGVARASSGTASATSAEDSIVAWVVPAPIQMDPFAALDALQLGHAAEVDQVVEDRQPQGEHRHQALAAGEDLRALAELGEQAARPRRGSTGAWYSNGAGFTIRCPGGLRYVERFRQLRRITRPPRFRRRSPARSS